MRVSNTSIADFLECLKHVNQIYDDTVRVSIYRNPVDGPDKNKAVKFHVAIQASALVITDSENEYILEAGELCGIDYQDSSQEFKASEKAKELREAVVVACGSRWKVLPGIISE